MKLVLASSSVYRQALLARLGVPFEVQIPALDEAPLADESAPAQALRLARLKASAVAASGADTLIIGSDQTAEIDGIRLGKPGGFDAAVEQLRRCSGRRVEFHTGVALLNARTGAMQSAVVSTGVVYRTLDPAQIERYVARDQPYDCAGSAKIESLGIALITAVHSEDPTALIGLPLICLTTMLAREGIALP